MKFFTIPDTFNRPVMLNVKQIVSIAYSEESEEEIEITMSNGVMVRTIMPRQILVDMVNKVSEQRVPVQTQTEWAG